MATLTSYLQPDYADSLGTNRQGSLATGISSGPITVGKNRFIHICASVAPISANRCALSYTMGNSTGTTAPTPVSTSPFLLGDEGYTFDTGLYDQINVANLAAYNGAVSMSYSISLLSKF